MISDTPLFPIIEKIDDILPYIRDHDEFVISNKGEYHVICYVVQGPDTFNSGDLISDSYRRECRGLIFDSDGNLVSRPFHKFFNVNEKEETQVNALSFDDVEVFSKLDGSMVRPLFLNGIYRLATKRGITDTSLLAENYLDENADVRDRYHNFFEFYVTAGYTPIFEWLSMKSRIVLNYPEDSLTLLAMRDNKTGEYIRHSTLSTICDHFQIPLVEKIWADDIVEFIYDSKEHIGIEGYVLAWPNGSRVKVKTEEYVKIHRAKDVIQSKRNVYTLIIDEKLDDLRPILSLEDNKYVDDIETDFHIYLNRRVRDLDAAFDDTKARYADKKEFAINTLRTAPMKGFIFSKYANKDTRRIVLDYIKSNLGQEKKFNEFFDEYFSK